MCIIIVKPKGAKLPSYSVLDTCELFHKDGAGFMYSEGNQTVINKGYFDLNSLVNALNELPSVQDLDLVIHFRTATAGTISQGNTHPYPITQNIPALTGIDITSKTGALAHNGILPKGAFSKADLKRYSDTLLFVRDCLAKLPQGEGLDAALEIVARATGSRFVLLNGTLKMFGAGWVEEGGCYFSNESYSWRSDYYDKYDEWDFSEGKDVCPSCGGTGELWGGFYVCMKCGAIFEPCAEEAEISEPYTETAEGISICPDCGDIGELRGDFYNCVGCNLFYPIESETA